MKSLCLLLIVCAGACLPAVVQEDYTLSVNDKTVYDLCASLADQSRVGLLADATAMQLLQKKISIKAKDVVWADVQFLLSDSYGLSVTLDDSYLRLRARAEDVDSISGQIAVYDMRLLCSYANMHPGPHLGIPVPDADIGNICTEIAGESDYEAEDFADLLDDMLNVSEERAEFSVRNGQICTLAEADTHQKINEILSTLEDAAARQLHCRIYDVTDKKAQLGQQHVLSATDWQALNARHCIGNFTLLNQVRNHYFCGAVHAYISDLDVVGDNYDPVIARIGSGLVVDVDGEMTVAGVVLTLQAQFVSEPSFATKRVSNGAGQAITTLKEPQIDVAQTQDARLVPYNGAALLRLGDKIYALECMGTAPQAMNVFKK